MDTNGYITFLVLGAVLVLIDGQLIYRSGRRYLQEFYKPETARSMMQLVTVLFSLVVLGMLALISLIDVNSGLPVRDVVVQLGMVLLMLALTHGFTLAILMKIRNRRRQEKITDEFSAISQHRAAHDVTVHPVTDEDSEKPQSAPTEVRW